MISIMQLSIAFLLMLLTVSGSNNLRDRELGTSHDLRVVVPERALQTVAMRIAPEMRAKPSHVVTSRANWNSIAEKPQDSRICERHSSGGPPQLLAESRRTLSSLLHEDYGNTGMG